MISFRNKICAKNLIIALETNNCDFYLIKNQLTIKQLLFLTSFNNSITNYEPPFPPV